MNNRALASLLLIAALTSTLSGCTSILGEDATKYPLVAQLSDKEVVDYYKEALSYDTIATRNLNVQETKYVTKDVSESKKKELTDLVGKIESTLSGMDYSYSVELDKLIKESTFNYIKAYLNDRKLTEGKITKSSEALGYYFVDVEYTISPRSTGTLKPQATLLGLHGAFNQDYLFNDTINSIYLKKATANLNKYYTDNGIDKTVTYNQSTQSLSMTNSKLAGLKFSKPVVEDKVEDKTETKETGDGVTAPTKETEKPADIKKDAAVASNSTSRISQIDTAEFNRMAGASISQSSYMPKISQVYTVPTSEGTIGGIGIFPEGEGGLTRFGYDRSKLSGTVTLRYVFKSNPTNPKETLGVSVYPVDTEVKSGFSVNTDDVVVPEFLMTEFNKLIERADRAIVNTDLPALMSGNIYSDTGVGVLRGYESKYTRLLRNMSKVRRVIARDAKNNAYLLEVETARQEGPNGIGSFGTYKDTSYVVVEQIGTEFVITDRLNMARKMTKEPAINPASAVTKRLVALNLAGAVSDESKEGIEQLMQDFYTAGTARVLHGPQEAKVNGTKTNVERGMYDCFNSDVTMLSKEKNEYLNSSIRQLLIKQGTDVDANYQGAITEWIGGADNQAEFTTEELISYDKRNATGHYMQVYYLVSNMGGKWVIDDMKIISEEDKPATEIKDIASRLGSK